MVLFVISPLCWVLLLFSSQSWMKCYAPWYVSYFHGKQDILPMQLHFGCHYGGLDFVRLLPCLPRGEQMTMLSYMFHWLWCILLPSLKRLYTPKGLISMILVHPWTGKCTETLCTFGIIGTWEPDNGFFTCLKAQTLIFGSTQVLHYGHYHLQYFFPRLDMNLLITPTANAVLRHKP